MTLPKHGRFNTIEAAALTYRNIPKHVSEELVSKSNLYNSQVNTPMIRKILIQCLFEC